MSPGHPTVLRCEGVRVANIRMEAVEHKVSWTIEVIVYF